MGLELELEEWIAPADDDALGRAISEVLAAIEAAAAAREAVRRIMARVELHPKCHDAAAFHRAYLAEESAATCEALAVADVLCPPSVRN